MSLLTIACYLCLYVFRVYTFAWIFGFFSALVLYYVINYFFPHKESLVAEAVYPPRMDDEAIEGAAVVTTDTKDPLVREKDATDSPV